MMYILLIIGFFLLVKGADYFVEGSSAIARLLKVPSVVIGLTIVAMGTSAPEAAVSITAGLSGSNELALSNVIGSNFFNLVFIVGICALIRPFIVDQSILKRDFPIAHQQPFYYNIPCHRVNVTENTLLHSICHGRNQISVNSCHHQSIHIPAPGLIASAVAPDGIIEAVEKPDYPNFFLGVQWHPEYLWDRDEAAMGLFQAFVDACK